MSLRWDPLLIRHLARELDDTLRGCRMRALRLDGASREASVLFREHTLHRALHPTRGAPELAGPVEPEPGDLPIVGRVRRVRAPTDERILVLEIIPARAGRSAVDIRVELLGNQWNLMATEYTPAEGSGDDEARIRHVLVRREDARSLLVGARYQPPAGEEREGREEPISFERWTEIVAGAGAAGRRRALVQAVAWTSSLNAGAFLPTGDPSDPTALRAGFELWRTLAHGDVPPQPVLLETTRGSQPYPWPLPGFRAVRQPTLLEAFGAWTRSAAVAVGTLLPQELLDALEAALDHASRRVTSLRAELDSAGDPAALRSVGDLVLARLREVRAGAGTVILEGFDGSSVEVELDPRVAPHENADAYYERAGRAQRALDRIPGLLEQAERRRDELASLAERVRDGEATAEEVRRAVPDMTRARQVRPGSAAPALPYRRYRTSGGLEVRVGRGARYNDELTFHHSAPQDVWLHARHAAGAHVVLRWGRAEAPPSRDLHEAAVLAALGSKARTSATVPVDWTFRKYVRKPRGSAPGKVVMERAHTVFVAPDPALAERMADEAPD